MYTLLIIVHILTCFFMIATILLQSGKGAEIGAAFVLLSVGQPFGVADVAAMPSAATTASASAAIAGIARRRAIVAYRNCGLGTRSMVSSFVSAT